MKLPTGSGHKTEVSHLYLGCVCLKLPAGKWGPWLAHLVEHVALDLRVMKSSPMFGIEITLKRKKEKI